jgi:hypothetical protein
MAFFKCAGKWDCHLVIHQYKSISGYGPCIVIMEEFTALSCKTSLKYPGKLIIIIIANSLKKDISIEVQTLQEHYSSYLFISCLTCNSALLANTCYTDRPQTPYSTA